MLKSNSYLAAIPFADKLAAEGKSVIPKPNTTMSELVRLSSTILPFKVEDDESLAAFGQVLEVSTQSSVDNESQYGLEMDGYINDISKLVTSHISFAKNVVKPIFLQFADNVKHYLETNKLKEASSRFEIKCLDIPEILLDDSFIDTLKYYEGKTLLYPEASAKLRLEVKTHEELVALLSTGRAKTDTLIHKWLARQDSDFLTNIWISFFTASTVLKDSQYYDFRRVSTSNAFEAADVALAVLLLSRKIYDDVQSTDLNLQAYQNFVVQLRDYAGTVLYNSFRKIELFVKNKNLVVEYGADHYTAKVNGLVYREWLDKGGSPEVIFGLIVSNNSTTSQTLIDGMAPELLKAWNSYVVFHNTNESNKVFDYYKNYLILALDMSYKDMSDEERKVVDANPNFYSTVKKLVDKEIDCLKASDMGNVYDVALLIIAKCRFYYTSSYSILSDINEAGKINPNVDVREAALLAAINYVSDYIAYQLTYING
jgi:hypothetical protein